MTNIYSINSKFGITPKPIDGTKVSFLHDFETLAYRGFHLLVEVSTADSFLKKEKSIKNSISTMGLFDTGASNTAIDEKLAKYLKLVSIGLSPSRTADGLKETPDYSINLSFKNYGLRPYNDLNVGSCNLNFNLKEALKSPTNITNFGLLIGRDIMANWNIVWHGPTSTVFISD